MPPLESFRDAESYYSTLAHEVTHWTKHEQRLNRDFGRKRWGDTGYASEELVAELGSAFLCADLELHQEPREDNASYIANWLEVLKNDNRAIFEASAYAQRAADYINQKAAAAQVLQTCAVDSDTLSGSTLCQLSLREPGAFFRLPFLALGVGLERLLRWCTRSCSSSMRVSSSATVE